MLLFLLSCSFSWAQQLTLKNEVCVFSFQTKAGKTVALSKEKKGAYLVYRFGKPGNVELEYPAKKDGDSWKRFQYNTYSRGGGKENAGMEIYNVMFENNGFRYVLFESYHAETDAFEVGIYVHNLTTNKSVRIPGLIASQKGDLSGFRYNGLLEMDDFGLFD